MANKKRGKAASKGSKRVPLPAAPPTLADLEIHGPPRLRSVWLCQAPRSLGFACKSDADPAAVAREVRAWLKWYQEEIAKRKAAAGIPPNRGGAPRKTLGGTEALVRRYEQAFEGALDDARLARSLESAAEELLAAADLKLRRWPKEKAEKVRAILRRAHPFAPRPRITSPLRLAQEIVAVIDEVAFSTVKAAMQRADKNPR